MYAQFSSIAYNDKFKKPKLLHKLEYCFLFAVVVCFLICNATFLFFASQTHYKEITYLYFKRVDMLNSLWQSLLCFSRLNGGWVSSNNIYVFLMCRICITRQICCNILLAAMLFQTLSKTVASKPCNLCSYQVNVFFSPSLFFLV